MFKKYNWLKKIQVNDKIVLVMGLLLMICL